MPKVGNPNFFFFWGGGVLFFKRYSNMYLLIITINMYLLIGMRHSFLKRISWDLYWCEINSILFLKMAKLLPLKYGSPEG